MFFERISEKQPSRIVFNGRTHFTNTWKSVCLEILESVFTTEGDEGLQLQNVNLPSTQKPICTDAQTCLHDFPMSNGVFFSGGLSEKEYAFSCYDICKLYSITPFELSIEYVGDRTVINVQEKNETKSTSDENAPIAAVLEETVSQDMPAEENKAEHKKLETKKKVKNSKRDNTEAKKIGFYYVKVQDIDKLKSDCDISKTTRNLAKILAKKAPEFSEKPCYYECSFVDNAQKVEAAATFVIMKESAPVDSGTEIDLDHIDAVCVRKNQMACLPYFERHLIRVFDESGEDL